MRLHKKTIAVSAAALTIIGGTAFAYLTEAGTGSGTAAVTSASGSVLLALAPDNSPNSQALLTYTAGTTPTFTSSKSGLEDIFKGTASTSGSPAVTTYSGGPTSRSVEVWAYNTGDTTRTVKLTGAIFHDYLTSTLSAASPTDVFANTSSSVKCSDLLAADLTSSGSSTAVTAGASVAPGQKVAIGTLTVNYSDTPPTASAPIATDGCVDPGQPATLTYTLN